MRIKEQETRLNLHEHDDDDDDDDDDDESIFTVHYTTSCKHSLVLLKMGEIIVRNMLS